MSRTRRPGLVHGGQVQFARDGAVRDDLVVVREDVVHHGHPIRAPHHREAIRLHGAAPVVVLEGEACGSLLVERNLVVMLVMIAG